MSSSRMILPDGYSDVPAGKIASVVTHLEMTERPVLPPDPADTWTLRKVDMPGLDWFRNLYLRVGEEWLWFSRVQMSDAELAAIIHRRWSKSMRWCRTEATRVCLNSISANPASANSPSSASPQN